MGNLPICARPSPNLRPCPMIHPEPLTATAFAPFGDVLDATGPFRLINDGQCHRFHDRAALNFHDAAPGISIFRAEPRALPYTFDLIERHPEGSQAFIPMHQNPFLIIVATNPQTKPKALLTNGHQAINLYRNIWHGVLTPLSEPGLFAVIDRIGPTPNLQEHRYATPFTISP